MNTYITGATIKRLREGKGITQLPYGKYAITEIKSPEGYEIDVENSTLDCIKFKPIVNFRYNNSKIISGWFISSNDATIKPVVNMYNVKTTHNVFATDKQAKSALAMAQISQIIANDKRFGGIVTDKEWNDSLISKYVIKRERNNIICDCHMVCYQFIAFHTFEQRTLFLKENEDLVRDYLML